MRNTFVGIIIRVLVAIVLLIPSLPDLKANGRFLGPLTATWRADGRTMKLEKDFAFAEQSGKLWKVPKGAVVDGASIPKFLWSVIGGPFTGKYRFASVIHDYYCVTQTEPYKSVHRVFYNASITSGVDKRLAWVMYQAVNRFGPRWEVASRPRPNCKIINKYNLKNCINNSELSRTQRARVVTKSELMSFLNDMSKGGYRAEAELISKKLLNYNSRP